MFQPKKKLTIWIEKEVLSDSMKANPAPLIEGVAAQLDAGVWVAIYEHSHENIHKIFRDPDMFRDWAEQVLNDR